VEVRGKREGFKLGRVELLARVRDMKDERIGTDKCIQAVDEHTAVHIDIVVENFRLKEERNARGTPNRIQNANLLRKHRRIVRGQIGRHNVER